MQIRKVFGLSIFGDRFPMASESPNEPSIPDAGEILPQHDSMSDVQEVAKHPPQCHSSLIILLMPRLSEVISGVHY